MAKRFTEIELKNIINDYNNGLKPYQLSRKYNRTSTTIIQKLKDLKLYENSRHRFTDDDIIFLRKYYPIGDWDSIHEKLPQVSKSSIHTKMSALGIESINDSSWTEDEINILKTHYSCKSIPEIMNILPKRSYKAICSKAKKLGIKRREFWSSEEILLLKEIYPTTPMNDVINYFPNRSRKAIISQARKLNLKSYDYNIWTKEEDEYIMSNWEILPDLILAQNLKRTHRATQARRMQLGLYRRNMDSTTYESLSKYIRGHIQKWKTESMKQCDYKCVLTGSKNFQIHHLYGVSNILNDIMVKNNFDKHNDIGEYTDDELNKILNEFIKEQDKYPLGVCISKDIHVLFHRLYGQHYNTPQQWYQFCKDYQNGIYSNLIE